MRNVAMTETLPDRPVSSTRQRVAAGLTRQIEAPLGDVPARRAAKTDEQRDAIRWERTARIAPFFDRACEVYLRDQQIKAVELAERMTVDPTQLSRMRSGERIIESFAEEVLRRHQPARAILTEADRPPPAITLANVERVALKVLIEDAARGDRGANAVLDEVARRLQVERGDIAEVIERGDDEQREPGSLD